MKCTNCGAEIDPSKKFCINCGVEIQQESVENLGNDSNQSVNNTDVQPESNTANVADVTSDVTNSTFEQNSVENSVESVENSSTPDPNDGLNIENSPLLNNNMDAYSYMNFQQQGAQPGVQQGVQPGAQQGTQQGAQQQGYNPIPDGAPKKKSNVGKIILIIVLIFVVLALIVGGIVGFVVYKFLKTADTLGETWVNLYNADSAAIVEDLPQEYMDEISDTYGYTSTDVQDAIDFMVADLMTSDFSGTELSVTEFDINTVSSDNATAEVVDAINSIFDDELADYESEFESVFVGTYAVKDSADSIKTVTETVSDGTDSVGYETILFKIDDTTYDGTEMIITDLCCYYYSIYQAYYTEYATDDSTATAE